MIFLLALLSLFLVFKPVPAKADNEFRLDQNISYSVSADGSALVNQETSLINNYSQIYAKEYKINLSGTNIKNITATDKTGNILNKVDQVNDTTSLNLIFNQPVLGKDQRTDFKINYLVPDFAQNKGNTWEISLPEFKNIKDTDTLNITLMVPASFGNLSFSSVGNAVVTNPNGYTKINLSGASLRNKRILFAFGNFQLFDFDLKYFIDNSEKDPVDTEIAVPPTTGSQKVSFASIDPKPQNITVDSDGNWLAKYYLKPGQNLEITVKGQVKITSVDPKKTDDPPSADLIKEDKYWPVSDSSIALIAQNLNTPRQIYDYVVKTLNYNYNFGSTVKRQGALEALLNPDTALCTEFTDLFVTLARAKGIPAREVEGFAYTNNPKIKPVNQGTDILHAWPQYYEHAKSRWISVDPTWEKTTNGIDYFSDLDLNHFAFVIHGHDSQYPSPPGSYKNNKDIKTVNINFATEELKSSQVPPSLEFEKTDFRQDPSLVISNTDINSIDNIIISFPQNNWQYQIKTLPPFGRQKINFPRLPFFTSILPKYQKISFEVLYNNSDYPVYQSSVYLPHYLNLAITIIVSIFILSLGGIILTVQKTNHHEKIT